MDLVEAPRGLPVWLKEGIGIKGIPKNVGCGTIAGNQRIFVFKEMFLTFLCKRKEEAP